MSEQENQLSDDQHLPSEVEMQPVPVGSRLIDCRNMAFLEDLAPGERQGMTATRAGYAEAVAEIMANQPVLGSEAGITHDEVEDIRITDERIAMIDARLLAARKLVELLEETRAKLDDRRNRRVFEIAGVIDVRSKARRTTTLLAAYQKTRAYRSAITLKSARTRRKNAMPQPAPTPEHMPRA